VNSDGSTDRIYSNGQYYIASSRKLHATLIFKPGTCEIQGGDVVVKMGDHPGSVIKTHRGKMPVSD
jgi:type 1 fimbria pilin